VSTLRKTTEAQEKEDAEMDIASRAQPGCPPDRPSSTPLVDQRGFFDGRMFNAANPVGSMQAALALQLSGQCELEIAEGTAFDRTVETLSRIAGPAFMGMTLLLGALWAGGYL
jgi:hypothetical protein